MAKIGYPGMNLQILFGMAIGVIGFMCFVFGIKRLLFGSQRGHIFGAVGVWIMVCGVAIAVNGRL